MSAVRKIKPALLNGDVDPQTTRTIQALRGVGLLADISHIEHALLTLALEMEERSFKKGEDIITEGAQGTELFILTEGRVAVLKATPEGDEYKVAIFDSAKKIAFGESGLIEADSRSATIRAEVDSVCLALGRESFEKFSKDHPEWALPIYRRIAHAVMARLKKTNNDMLLIYNALVAEIRGHQ